MSSVEQSNQENNQRGKVNGSLQKILGKRFLPGNKRTVLGTLTSNVRIQPRRAAKQTKAVAGKENASKESSYKSQNSISNSVLFSHASTSSRYTSSTSSDTQTFTIYKDPTPGKPKEPEIKDTSQPTLDGSNVTASKVSDILVSNKLINTLKENQPAPPKISAPQDKNVLKETAVSPKEKENIKDIKIEPPSKVMVKIPTALPKNHENTGYPFTQSDKLDFNFGGTKLEDLTKEAYKGAMVLREQEQWDCLEYSVDIYYYLRSLEKKASNRPKPNYMRKQTDITPYMRWVLIDWLVEVSGEYNLTSQCLNLAVSFVDRFLSHMSVKRDKLQLVGISAIFIASKFEEIFPPEVSQLAYITDNTYRVGQILRMEHLIAKVINFDASAPTIYDFVNIFARYMDASDETTYLAQFLGELSMLDSDPFLKYLPSIIAASALALANYTQGNPAWPKIIEEKSLYIIEDLKECYVHLHKAFCKVHVSSSHAIKEKYRNARYKSVSNLSPREGFPF